MTPPERTPPYRSAEHRQYRRYPTGLTAIVWAAQEDGAVTHGHARFDARAERLRTAYIENLSLNGLYFVSDWAFPLESLVWVRLRIGSQTIQAKAQVRRAVTVRLTGQQCFGCGVQFVRAPETVQAVTALAVYLERLKAKIPAVIPPAADV